MSRKSSVLRRLCDQQEWKCHYCEREMLWVSEYDAGETATYDHIIPRRKGGGNGVDNGVAACMRCNQARGSMDYETYKFLVEVRRDRCLNQG